MHNFWWTVKGRSKPSKFQLITSKSLTQIPDALYLNRIKGKNYLKKKERKEEEEEEEEKKSGMKWK